MSLNCAKEKKKNSELQKEKNETISGRQLAAISKTTYLQS